MMHMSAALTTDSLRMAHPMSAHAAYPLNELDDRHIQLNGVLLAQGFVLIHLLDQSMFKI